LSDKAWR